MKFHISPAAGASVLLAVAAVVVIGRPAPSDPPKPRAVPPDLSGLAWIKGDSFLAVHDGKEPGLPRISVVLEPRSADGPLVRPLRVKGLETEPVDLESIARVPPKPGAPADAPLSFLMAESGSNPGFRRLFHATYSEGDDITLKPVGNLPALPGNVDTEGLALYRMGSRLLMLFADRSEGERLAFIWVFPRSLDGEPSDMQPGFEPIRLALPDTGAPRTRLISAMEFDRDGNLYVASAADPGVDTGPYRSHVWRVGWAHAKGDFFSFEPEKQGQTPRPLRVATVDGMKVESLAVREAKPGVSELFFGTDDEFYGGAMRSLGVLPR